MTTPSTAAECLVSNDLLADRRFAWATALARNGDLEAAADLFEQVVDRVPDWAPGWAALAEVRGRLFRPDASTAWKRVLALDPSDRFGAALHLARLSGDVPDAMPNAYVQAVFDDYAPRFEQHLVDDLGYCGPRVVRAALHSTAADRRFRRGLDLGCGTGLMARAVRSQVAAIDGIDLSPRMIDQARATGVYADLRVGPLQAALDRPAAYDLVMAADVLTYVGSLEPVLQGVARTLEPGGLFAWTVQALVRGRPGQAMVLGPDLRFAHARDYLDAAVASAGLTLLMLDDMPVRREQGVPVPGFVGVVRRPP